MKFAYSDPPYLGCCNLYDHFHGDDGMCWDDPETHRVQLEYLSDTFPDGWAYSATSGSLRTLLPLCPPDVRVAAWVKPFAAFKRNVRVAYTWEPVIFRGGRVSSKDGAPPCRDHISVPITMRRGFTGAKPEAFCRWVMDMLGWIPGDKFVDVFIGSGAFTDVVAKAKQEIAFEQEVIA